MPVTQGLSTSSWPCSCLWISELCARETKSCLCFLNVLVECLSRVTEQSHCCHRTNTAGLTQDRLLQGSCKLYARRGREAEQQRILLQDLVLWAPSQFVSGITKYQYPLMRNPKAGPSAYIPPSLTCAGSILFLFMFFLPLFI